jgi:hypothetical protein
LQMVCEVLGIALLEFVARFQTGLAGK